MITVVTILALVAMRVVIGPVETFWFALGALMMSIFAMWEAGGKVERE